MSSREAASTDRERDDDGRDERRIQQDAVKRVRGPHPGRRSRAARGDVLARAPRPCAPAAAVAAHRVLRPIEPRLRIGNTAAQWKAVIHLAVRLDGLLAM